MIIPPRYYISFIESEFMAGGVNEIRLANAFYLTILGLILFAGVYKKTQIRLEASCPSVERGQKSLISGRGISSAPISWPGRWTVPGSGIRRRRR